MTAEKATYLPGRYPDNGRTVRSRGRTLVLRDGQIVEDIRVLLYRAGAIVGRVVDAHGDPVEYANISLMRVAASGRVSSAVMRGANSTNDPEVLERLVPSATRVVLTAGVSSEVALRRIASAALVRR